MTPHRQTRLRPETWEHSSRGQQLVVYQQAEGLPCKRPPGTTSAETGTHWRSWWGKGDCSKMQRRRPQTRYFSFKKDLPAWEENSGIVLLRTTGPCAVAAWTVISPWGHGRQFATGRGGARAQAERKSSSHTEHFFSRDVKTPCLTGLPRLNWEVCEHCSFSPNAPTAPSALNSCCQAGAGSRSSGGSEAPADKLKWPCVPCVGRDTGLPSRGCFPSTVMPRPDCALRGMTVMARDRQWQRACSQEPHVWYVSQPLPSSMPLERHLVSCTEDCFLHL